MEYMFLLHCTLYTMGNTSQEAITSNDKVEIIDKYTSLIEKIKNKLFSGLWYDQAWEFFYNRAYFTTDQKITEEYIHNKIAQGNNIILQLQELIQQVENENILNTVQKKLITDSIKRSVLLTRYHQHAIYIEAEKWWYPLSNTDRIYHRKEIIQIEDELYWEAITQREWRKNRVITKLHEIYWQNMKELTEEEKWIWQNKILHIFPMSTAIHREQKEEKKEKIYINEKHIFDMVALLLEIEWFDQDNIIKIQIGAPDEETLRDWYDLENKRAKDWIYYIPDEWTDKELYAFFDNQWIGQNFKIIKRKLGNNSVGISKKDNGFSKNHINLVSPKNGEYDLKEKILPILYDHEVWTHINTGIGNFNNIYMKDPKRPDLEEWIALFNQAMTENKDIQELYETSIWDIGMFLSENFDEYELKQIFDIYFKLTKEKNRKIDDQIRRNKMWIPIWEKWARRKDITHWNGKEIIKELENLTKTPEWIELLNRYAKAIYSTRLWYDSIKNIDNVLDWIKKIDELEPNFSIFAGKIIYWKLFKGKLDKDKMLENDLRRFIHTNKKVTDKQKRLLVKIIHIIKEYWEGRIE